MIPIEPRYVGGVDTRRLGPLREHRFPTLSPANARPGLVASAALAVVAGILFVSGRQILSGLALACAIALASYSWLRAAGVNRGIAASAGRVVYRGRPGTVAGADGVFGEKAGIGAAGEKRTAELLDLLRDHVPGLYVFHGVRFPGSKRADIDHVLVYGNQVMLLDSKLFAAGRYSLVCDRSGDWRISGGRHGDSITPMPDAVAKMQAALGPSARVRGAIVVHGKDSDVVASRGAPVAICKPEELLNSHLIRFTAAAPDPRPRRAILDDIASRLIG